jgi:hypothetical protein
MFSACVRAATTLWSTLLCPSPPPARWHVADAERQHQESDEESQADNCEEKEEEEFFSIANFETLAWEDETDAEADAEE